MASHIRVLRYADDELIEVRRIEDHLDPVEFTESICQVVRLLQVQLCNLSQSVGADARQIDGRSQRAQRRVRADV